MRQAPSSCLTDPNTNSIQMILKKNFQNMTRSLPNLCLPQLQQGAMWPGQEQLENSAWGKTTVATGHL